VSWESLFDRVNACDVTEAQIRDLLAERRADKHDEGAVPDEPEGEDE
jgi:hypothetical protein